MPKTKFSYLYISLFGIFLLMFFLYGYVALVQHAKENETGYLFFLVTFSSLLIFAIVVLCRVVLSFNAEIEERRKLQENHINQIRQTYEGTLQALTKALDYRDHGTWGHSARVVGYAMAIGEKMNLEEEDLGRLAWGGFLHDIGKIGVSDAVLLKEAALNNEEWRLIQQHPRLGYDIIEGIDFLKETSDIILLHHERYDGKGYPYGMEGGKIPLLARIFAVADALDAITSDRPYRPARSVATAVEEIVKLSGKQFCPESVAALLDVGIDEVSRIQRQVGQDGNKFYHSMLPFNRFDFVS